jgi:hypothetical protein
MLSWLRFRNQDLQLTLGLGVLVTEWEAYNINSYVSMYLLRCTPKRQNIENAINDPHKKKTGSTYRMNVFRFRFRRTNRPSARRTSAPETSSSGSAGRQPDLPDNTYFKATRSSLGREKCDENCDRILGPVLTSLPGLNEGVNSHPRGHGSPLCAKFTLNEKPHHCGPTNLVNNWLLEPNL